MGNIRREGPSPVTLQLALTRFIEQSQTPGGALAWSQGGEPARFLSAGNDYREPAAPISSRSGFLIASLTKMFTGILILRLVDEGRIGLDTSVGELIPSWPELRNVTARHLLSHASGIPAAGADDGSGTGLYRQAQRELLEADRTRRFSLEETLEWLQGRPLLSEPGTEVHYSNTNSLLLAHLAETVAERPFAELLRQHVLDPLGLFDTWDLSDETAVRPFVAGCFERDGVLQRTEDAHMVSLASHVGAAGALVSSAADLATFGLGVLRGRRLLSDSTASQAFTIGAGGTGLGVLGIRRASPGQNVFGVFDAESRAGEFIGYGGSGLLPGTSAKLVYLTEVDTLLLLLLNRSTAPGGGEFFRMLIEAFLDPA